MANQSIWGATDRGPVVGTYRIPVDTGASSGPGYITATELGTFTSVVAPTRVAFSTTSKTLALTDANTIQDCSNAATQTITIPLNATVAFPVSTIVGLERNGAGQVTITAVSGAVTLNGVAGGSITIGAQYTGAYLVQESTNVWYLEGGIGANTTSAGITVDGGGTTITTGSKGFTQINFNCTIAGWTILGDVSGSCVIDILRSTYAAFPTTVSIVGGGNAPTLSGAQKNTAAPSGWTSTSIVSGDIIEFSVSSASGIARANLILNLTKT